MNDRVPRPIMTLLLVASLFGACGPGRSDHAPAPPAGLRAMSATGGSMAAPQATEEIYAVADVDYESPMELEAELLRHRVETAATPTPPPPAAAKQAPAKQKSAMPDGPRAKPSAERGPLLVYEAWLQLAVYEVEQQQRKVIELAESLDGFLQKQDARQVIVRVPASRFKEALEAIEAIGDLRGRQVQTHDVTEEFRDIQTRLDSARKVRKRLLELLDKAVNVEESLAIERELERLLKEIERMEGKLKFLSDRIALSTITVGFSPIAEETPADDVTLPFPWLDGLGLRNLTEL